MKSLICVALFALSQLALSQMASAENCVSTIKQGSHSAPTEADAKLGAYEDSDEQCYPGEAIELGMECEPASFYDGEKNWDVVRCERQVQCLYCGDVLADKVEQNNL